MRATSNPLSLPGGAWLTNERVQWLLTLLGILVAGYLSWVHLAGSKALCAGVGQCDVVQASAYAKLLGIPVAYLGLGMYLAVAGLLAARARLPRAQAEMALLAQFCLLLFGVLFSAWLTYVELYVIYAICPYCVTSALLTLLLFGAAARDLATNRALL